MARTNRNQFRLFILIVLMGSNLAIQAQSIIDSLKTELNNASGTNRVDILCELSNEMKFINSEQSLTYAQEAISLAQANSYPEGAANAYIIIGNVYRKLSEFNHSTENYEQALEISRKAGYVNGIARAYNGLGIANSLLGNYDKSLESFLNALKIHEQHGDSAGTADALNNIGIHYLFTDNPEQALEYYKKALKIRREIGNIESVAASLNNIGDVYADLGRPDEALQYFKESLSIREGEGNPDLIFALQINIGLLYSDLDDQDKAMEYYNKGLEIAEKIGDNWGIATTYNYMGLTHLKMRHYGQAEKSFKKSLLLAREIEAKSVVKDVYRNLSDLSLEIKDYKRSLEYFKQFTEIKDSIFNETTSKQIAEMQTRYETEKKEAEINKLTVEKTIQELKLKKSDNLKWFFFAATILILLLAGFIFFGFRQKQKANKLLVERNKLEIENKNRALSLFGQQVSKEVAMELLSDSAKTSSRKLFACIMFLDIRDFTPYAENKEPAEIIQYQNDVFGFMIDIVSKHHGIINQFIGDGFMATFGAPTSTGNDCQNAVNASFEIVELLNNKCDSGEIPETRVGIGLHAGDIVTGNVGTSERKQYTVTGNAVILASRIEQLNKKFNSSILISLEVLENLDRTNLKFENLGSERIKGRVEPMEIIRLI